MGHTEFWAKFYGLSNLSETFQKSKYMISTRAAKQPTEAFGMGTRYVCGNVADMQMSPEKDWQRLALGIVKNTMIKSTLFFFFFKSFHDHLKKHHALKGNNIAVRKDHTLHLAMLL